MWILPQEDDATKTITQYNGTLNTHFRWTSNGSLQYKKKIQRTFTKITENESYETLIYRTAFCSGSLRFNRRVPGA